MRKPTDVDAHVGMRLRSLRESSGLTQAELASRLGFSFQQLQKYERGINRVSASRLVEFATLLNVPLTAFFEGVETVGDGEGASQVGALLSAFSRLKHEDDRAKALAAIQALAG